MHIISTTISGNNIGRYNLLWNLKKYPIHDFFFQAHRDGSIIFSLQFTLRERQLCKKKWPKKFLNSVGHVKTFKTLFSHQSRSFDRLVECRPVIGHNYLKNNFCTVCLVYLLSLLKILIGSSLCPKQPFFSFRSPFIPSIFFCQTRTSSILYSFLPSPLCVY